MGGIWAVQSGPLWHRAVGLVGLSLVGPPVIHLVRARLRRHRARSGPRISLTRFFAAKAIVVAFALIATWLLGYTHENAPLHAGLLMAMVIAIAGPILHPHLLIPEPEPAAEPAFPHP
ncbi:hypothetical protein [Nocardia sp. CA-120079]|uniref:hypothetical protein n=1 Tax=Nocardia sp. CA-120079 TaxID=3239974 RepID=UPI003D954DA4